MTLTPLTPFELLERMSVAELGGSSRTAPWRGVYVVGCYDRRVSVYAQQVRALNLIDALLTVDDISLRITPGQRIAVIGAGFAGLTAAAAAARAGIEVWLLEERSVPLFLQAGCDKREIHPRIYDWPRPGAEQSSTDHLGILPWSAAEAKEVVRKVRVEVDKVIGETKRLWPTYDVSQVRIFDSRRVFFNPGVQSEEFAAVLLTVGFGFEPTVAGTRSYWRDDGLEQWDIEEDERILISGVGDGGLIDLARATIPEFRQTNLLARLGLDQDTAEKGALVRDLLRIEEEASKLGTAEARRHLWKEYRGLNSQFLDARLWPDGLQTRRKVTLNGRYDEPFGLESAILNRLLASRIILSGRATYLPGELERGSLKQKRKGGWQVRIGPGIERCTKLLLRHGPEPAAIEQGALKEIDGICGARLRGTNANGRTRVPIWGDGPWPHLAGARPDYHRDAPIRAMGEVRRRALQGAVDCMGRKFSLDLAVRPRMEARGRFDAGFVPTATRDLSLEDLVDAGARWFVHGETGAGKSTLLLLLEWSLRDDPSRVPARVDLSRLDDGRLLDVLEADLLRFGPAIRGLGARVATLAAAGRVVFLLDAADQVPEGRWGAVLREIENLSAQAPRCAFVVTHRNRFTRTIDHFEVAELLPLDNDGRLSLLKPLVGESSARTLLSSIDAAPGMSSLGAVPLHLRFLADPLLRGKAARIDGEVPHGAALLLDRLFSGDRHVRFEARVRSFLQHLAFDLLVSGRVSAKLEEIDRGRTRESWEALIDTGEWTELAQFFNHVADRTGIILFDGTEVRFTHGYWVGELAAGYLLANEADRDFLASLLREFVPSDAERWSSAYQSFVARSPAPDAALLQLLRVHVDLARRCAPHARRLEPTTVSALLRAPGEGGYLRALLAALPGLCGTETAADEALRGSLEVARPDVVTTFLVLESIFRITGERLPWPHPSPTTPPPVLQWIPVQACGDQPGGRISLEPVDRRQYGAFERVAPFRVGPAMTEVSWHRANAWCDWYGRLVADAAGARLPTHDEWRRASASVSSSVDSWCLDGLPRRAESPQQPIGTSEPAPRWVAPEYEGPEVGFHVFIPHPESR